MRRPRGRRCISRLRRANIDQLIARCAGLDVHQKSVTACLRVPGDGDERVQEILANQSHSVISPELAVLNCRVPTCLARAALVAGR